MVAEFFSSPSLLLIPAHAITEFPPTMPAESRTLSLNGVGTRKATIFKVKVYDAALYLEKKSKNAEEILDSNQIKRVDMFFLRDRRSGKDRRRMERKHREKLR